MIPNHTHKDAMKVYISLFIGVFIFACGIFLAQFLISKEKELNNTFYPNVYIDGVSAAYKTKDQVDSLYQSTNSKLDGVTVNVLYQDQKIATLSAQQIGLHSNVQDVADRAYQIGRNANPSARVLEKLTSIFYLRRYNFFTSVTYDKATLRDIVSDFEDQYNKPAKNALFTFQDGRVASFREDEKGIKLQTDAFFTDFDKKIAALDKKPKDITITMKDTVIQPDITLAKANDFGIEELIASGESNFSHSIPGRIHNVELAASKFNGVIIPKGDTLSFNKIVGDISANTGYQQAYIIQNGKTVLGDGGGVCQVSTTLFRVAMNAGLPILERTAHAYRVGYYENDAPPGFDATVYAPSVDLKIKNDTSTAILIQTHIDEATHLLDFYFYGKKDGRVATITKPIVTDQQPAPPPRYDEDPTLARGIVNQVDFAASGAKSTFTYTVINNGQTTFEKTFISIYRPWQAVFLVGTKDG